MAKRLILITLTIVIIISTSTATVWAKPPHQSEVGIGPNPGLVDIPDYTCSITKTHSHIYFMIFNQSASVAPPVLIHRTITWHEVEETVLYDTISATGSIAPHAFQIISLPYQQHATGYYVIQMDVDVTGSVIESSERNNTCVLDQNPYAGVR